MEATNRLAPEKFRDPLVTARGDERARVSLTELETLWLNTGTLCNITCQHCYIESSPLNDRLVYLSADEVTGYLDEIAALKLGTRQIGITGGEPFMNPEIIPIITEVLKRGFALLVLTNAMRPMQRHQRALLELQEHFGRQLTLRVSMDHYTAERHELERGRRSWRPTLDGLKWLSQHGFQVAVAGRTLWDESQAGLRAGFARLFEAEGIGVDAADPAQLVLFPEMDEAVDVPEISVRCWDILQKSPDSVMCASSRMVVKRKGAKRPVVLACTLIAYDEGFETGQTLAQSVAHEVPLNHPHCARFCVLGGASCSA